MASHSCHFVHVHSEGIVKVLNQRAITLVYSVTVWARAFSLCIKLSGYPLLLSWLQQFSTGGSFSQNPPRTFDRPDNRNDRLDNNLRRSVPRFAGGRRDSSGSSHSDRSQISRWQPAQGNLY